MINIWDMIRDSGVVGWLTCFIGIIGAGIMFERAYVLYFKFGMDIEQFFHKIQSLVLARKFDEALVIAAGLNGKPLANAFKTILEKADRDDDAIFQAHDIAMSENVPLFTKRIHYLSMLANVATLMGLLGTIVGLILSFKAVGAADPSEKQALLANGISISMYTTALGLAVSIPVMVFYSFLVARQNQLVEQLTEKCGKLTEMLTGSHIPSLSRQSVYPEGMNKDQMVNKSTPPANIKAG